jgi:hypothetical protein
VDVSSLLAEASPSSDVNLVLLGLSSTNLSISSREATNKPQLLVTTD